MDLMRRLRVSRSDADSSAASDEMGLDAFGAEDGSPAAAPPASGARATFAQSHIVIGVLALLVLIEAVPTGLWIRNRLRPPAPPVTAAALPPAAAIPLASCSEPAGPSPAAPATATPAAATSGVARGAGSVPARSDAAVAPPVPAVDKSMLAGTVTVSAPVPMQILSRGRLVGTTEAESFMLPVGTHELEFVNQTVGFRARRTVTVQAGKTSPVKLDAPSGTVSINAVPWAEVWMDGRRIGETPIGNLSAPIGARELVFRHPDFGERKASIMVTLKEPARISMDLRKK